MTEGEHGDFMKNMQPIPKTPMYLPFLDPVYMWIKLSISIQKLTGKNVDCN